MNKRRIEVAVGLFMTIAIFAMVILAMKVSNLGNLNIGDTYKVSVEFENIGGLTVNSPIKSSGVLVGRVGDINYDNNYHNAIVSLSIYKKFNKFSKDTSASIYTAGLLGEQYVGLTPGAEDEHLVDGDTIIFANSAVILEKLIGHIMAEKISE